MSQSEQYNHVREHSRKYYVTLVSLKCPALANEVSFNAHGFNHIIYRKGRTERDRVSQIMRFKLLKKAYTLIGLTTTIQEYEVSKKDIIIQKHGTKILTSKEIQYWGIIAIMDEYKIKVILRKIGNGSVHFWSVVPAWVTNKTRDGKYIRTTIKGDPEND